MLLLSSGLLTTWLRCYATWPIIVDGKYISGSIDTYWYKPNFTWIINAFWFIIPPFIRRIAEGHLVLPLSVCSVRTSVQIRVRAITPKPYGIYLWNFTGACMTLRRCVMNKEDNSCLFGFWINCPWLSSICPVRTYVRPNSCPGHNS